LTLLSTRTRTPSGRSTSMTPRRSANADRAARAYRASRHWHYWALARCVVDDTNLNEFRRRDSSGSRCQTRGLPCRSPIV
jgi:hypothetical protein